jgi:hypothetical protein
MIDWVDSAENVDGDHKENNNVNKGGRPRYPVPRRGRTIPRGGRTIPRTGAHRTPPDLYTSPPFHVIPYLGATFHFWNFFIPIDLGPPWNLCFISLWYSFGFSLSNLSSILESSNDE